MQVCSSNNQIIFSHSDFSQYLFWIQQKGKINKFKIMENNTEIRKTETLHIRLTPDDKQLIEQYAKMIYFTENVLLSARILENWLFNSAESVTTSTKSRTPQILLRRFQIHILRRCRNWWIKSMTKWLVSLICWLRKITTFPKALGSTREKR